MKNINRCAWCGNDELYIQYHDQEWGKLITNDKVLFEFLVLESAQAGLSWITILRKREGYRQAFHNFDIQRVANMSDHEIDTLMNYDGIVRNRLKIRSTISNARLYIDIQNEFGSFFNYIISFFPNGQVIVNNYDSHDQLPTSSVESDAISKDMKKRGFKFFGTTICYAFLQATGFVNDHLSSCAYR